MKRNHDNHSEESERRWEFIERASKEVSDWPDWKKVEVTPEKYRKQEQSCNLNGIYTPSEEVNLK